MAVMLEVSKKVQKQGEDLLTNYSSRIQYHRSVHIPWMTLGRLTKSGEVGIGFCVNNARAK